MTRGRRRWHLAVPFVVAVLLTAAPATRTPAAGQTEAHPEPAADAPAPVVHTPSPAPGAVVAAGDTQVTAGIRSPHPITSARLSVDGVVVEQATVDPHEGGGWVTAGSPVPLASGEHSALLEVEDAAGGRAERTWTFAATDHTATRIAGSSRFDTAVAVSAATYPEDRSASAAVLARADDFADALAGAPLAAAVDGPLLLAGRHALGSATAEELRRVLEPGATVHLLGGPQALPATVADDVADLGFRTVRHAGADRFATAAEVARQLPASAGAVVVSGTSFPDSLAASAPAARDGLPILLTAADHQLAEATAAVLAERDVSTVTIVGGPRAVATGSEEELRERVPEVERVAGPDRYATAAAVLEAFYDRPSAVSLASGAAFPDALTGTRHAASRSQPLLLTHPQALSPATDQALRAHRPRQVTVYGGPAAVADGVMRAARGGAVDGPDAPRVTGTTPAAGGTVAYLDAVTVTLDRPVDPAGSSVHVVLAGIEVAGAVEETQPAATLTFRPADGQPAPASDQLHDARVVVAARDGAGVGHDEAAFSYLQPHPVFAAAPGVPLHLPSRDVEMVGFHQANHHGAQQLTARSTATSKMTLPSRDRATGSSSAADVVAAPDMPVLAPVTGRVLRAGSYVLYCRYADDYAVIEPDDRPGWEVKILHFHGLRVRAGDRVDAFRSVLGDGPRTLPFASQVDAHSADRNWPHVHVEVVDPSVPTPPGSGC